jgi:hypothetical protein
MSRQPGHRHSARPGNVATAFAAGLGGTTVVVVCLGLLIGVLSGGGESSARDSRPPEEQISSRIDELFAAFAAGDCDDIWRTGTTLNIKEALPRAQFAEMGVQLQKMFGSLKGKTQTKFIVREVGGSPHAEAHYNGDFEKGPGVIHAEYRKIDSKWLLLQFAVELPEKKS